MSKSDSQSAPQQSDLFEKKTDMALAEIARLSEDPDERNRVFEEIYRRHNQQVVTRLRRVLPIDWVETTKQQIWEEFSYYICANTVDDDLSKLLRGFVRNIRADAIKQVKREREIEFDKPVEDYASLFASYSPEDISIVEEEQQEISQQFSAHYQHLFLSFLLTDCQRVLLELSSLHGYRTDTISRLLGKKRGTIYEHKSAALKRVDNYLKSAKFQMAVESRSLTSLWSTDIVPPNSLVVDRFSEKILPQFTPEELKPIGITMSELTKFFEFSLLFPHSLQENATSLTSPSLLLMRKTDHKKLDRIYKRLQRNPDSLPDEFPVEALIRMDVEDGNFILSVDPMVQIFPDPDQLIGDDHFMMLHSPRMRLPIVLATYDDDLSEFTGDRRIWRRFYNI